MFERGVDFGEDTAGCGEWPGTVEGIHADVLPHMVTWTHHGEDVVAAVENGLLSAAQCHPEKSGDAGATVLENWLKSLT